MSLNPYQKATVKHLAEVYQRQQVYLVADEVGLGKTYVAQGLIEAMGFKRIMYIASNPEVAAQNAKKLCGKEAVLTKIDRLSMLESACQTDIRADGTVTEVTWTKDAQRPWVLPLSPATTFTGAGSDFGNQRERDYYSLHKSQISKEWNSALKREEQAQQNQAPQPQKRLKREQELDKKADELTLQYLRDAGLQWLHDSTNAHDYAAKKAAKRAFRHLRHCFCEVAVSSFQPDLIILDEFHRFHQLLKPENFAQQHYSLKEMIRTANAARQKAGRKPVKLLLLSATPYEFQTSAFERVYQDATKEDRENHTDQNDAYGKPFRKFEDLVGYISGLEEYSGGSENGWERKELKDFNPEDYYRHVLCRTERKWLQAGQSDVPYHETMWERQEAYRRIGKHLVYRREYLNSLLIDAAEKDAIGNALAVQRIQDSRDLARPAKQSEKDGRDALQSYSNVRSFLDEAPEYAQFGDAYKTVAQGSTGTAAKVVKMRTAFSEVLRRGDRYRIKKAPAGGEPDPVLFEKTYGHAKWDKLREMAMPEDAELRLWVPPVRREEAFSKTVVFAHYRLSTRSVAALTSMEAQKRLCRRIQAAAPTLDAEQLQDIVFNENQLMRLMEPAAKFMLAHLHQADGGFTRQNWTELAGGVRKFFNTTHAKRVLTAWSGAEATGDTALAYCDAYDWGGMVWEYLECLCGMEPDPAPKDLRAALQELTEVLSWTDEMRTRVLVLPDWADEGYPCTFGERYTPDYSDKKGHDADESSGEDEDGEVRTKKKPPVVVTKRLQNIRKRFQSPFYPFVLAASETAQEGVDLHHYCANIFHWSVPSRLNTFTQEGGRVDRRASLTMRRQAVWLQRKAHPEGAVGRSVADLFGQLESIYQTLGWEPAALAGLKEQGLFPYWFLPAKAEWLEQGDGFPQLQRVLFGLPMSGDEADYQMLLAEQKQYRTFGLTLHGRELSDEELKNSICPFLQVM